MRLLAGVVTAGLVAGCVLAGGSRASAADDGEVGVRSAGCARGAHRLAVDAHGDARLSFQDQGVARSALVHVPAGRAGRVRPLVMSFHGAGSTGDAQRFVDHFADLGDQEGFVTVYPNGELVDLGPFGVANLWNIGTAGGPIDESAFVSHVLDVVEGGSCIDEHRVFATGISLGGGMARLVGCELTDRFAAFAPVSPVTPRPCTAGEALPMVGFHGTADLVLPYAGTAVQQPAEQWAAEQAARNGCRPGAIQRETIGAVDRLGWRGCEAATTFYRVNGAGHSWPGSPPPVPRDVLIALLTPVAPLFGLSPEQLADTFLNTNLDIDATRVIWSFFKAHPRRD